jgi:SEC-C motif-containing protein
MRSRYTAHVLSEIDYLWDTWSPEERSRSSKADIEAWTSNCEWLGLKITGTKAGGKKDRHGVVSFVALFRQNDELHEHHEVSLFKKTALGNWLYVDHKK